MGRRWRNRFSVLCGLYVLCGYSNVFGEGRPETQYAHELVRLNQPSVIKAELAKAKGTVAENLWTAQLILVSWDSMTATKEGRAAAERDYIGAVNGYLASLAASNRSPDG